MSPFPALSGAAPRPRRAASAMLLALALGACAQFPFSSERVALMAPDRIRASTAFAGPVAAWPAERWWASYGDPQLDALIDEALRDAPDMTMAAARLRRAEAAGEVAGAALLPQASANAAATSQKQSGNYLTPKGMLPEGWQDYGRATLDFAWEIDFWGRNRAGLAAATSELEASRADAAQARLALASGMATGYAELARLYAARETAEAAAGVRRKSVQLFAERFAHGLETRGSVKEAEARLAGAEGDLLQLDEQIGLQKNRLAALAGAGPDRGLAIERPVIALDRPHGLPSELAANLLGRRPDVVAARLQAEAKARRIDQKRAEFYPNVNLSAFLGVQSLGLNLLAKEGSGIGSVGPAISLPLFNGGRLRGELRGAEAAHDEAVATYNRTLTQAIQEVADAFLSQKALAPRLAKAGEACEAAGEAYRVALNRYQGGLSGYLEVLSAQDALLANLRALTDLQSRAFTLDVALTRALGGGYRAIES